MPSETRRANLVDSQINRLIKQRRTRTEGQIVVAGFGGKSALIAALVGQWSEGGAPAERHGRDAKCKVALTLAMVARFGFCTPRDVASLLFRYAMRLWPKAAADVHEVTLRNATPMLPVQKLWFLELHDDQLGILKASAPSPILVLICVDPRLALEPQFDWAKQVIHACDTGANVAVVFVEDYGTTTRDWQMLAELDLAPEGKTLASAIICSSFDAGQLYILGQVANF